MAPLKSMIQVASGYKSLNKKVHQRSQTGMN